MGLNLYKSDQLVGHKNRNGQVNLNEAKAQLGALVARAEAGEAIQISRRGKPVARLTSLSQPRKPIDVSALRFVIDTMPKGLAENVVLTMRDEARY